MRTEWEEKFLREEAEAKRYREEVGRTRRLFSRSNYYGGTVIAETVFTLFLIGTMEAAADYTELEFPTTRIGWYRLVARGLILVWMFHVAHTTTEAMFRRRGL